MLRRAITSLLVLIANPLACLGQSTQAAADHARIEHYLYPSRDVDPSVLKSGDGVVVTESAECWTFTPAGGQCGTSLLFFPGGGVDPKAYAPLLRGVAKLGFAVQLAKLPGKPPAPDKHRQSAIALGNAIINANPHIKRWVVGGHSMGATIAARFVYEAPEQFRGLVLIGTTHPRDFDLSRFTGDVTKVYGTEDGVASEAKSEANRKLLPAATTWVRVEGGNHAQFGYYGAQFGDGKATITREAQRQQTGDALLRALRRVSEQAE